jgi:uncharacterized protein YjiS (DUF1127 family)
MATPSTHRLAPMAHGGGAGRSVWAVVRAGLAWLIATLAREREIRRSMRLLATFDDYMLHDIGITRGDIERVVRFGRD